MVNYLIILILLFLLELVFFRLADHFNIIDKPNERSSHSEITIRGGGIVFYFGVLVFFLMSGYKYPFFFLGLTLISVISFLDDILTLSSRIRLPIQFFSVFLLLYQVVEFDWMWLIIGIVIATGAINAFNFMDGINGITGVYSLVTIATLYYINIKIHFIDDSLLIISILSVLVFNFFNFRKKAKCFAGDIGSVSIAFIIIFSIFKLIQTTGSFWWLLLVMVYGMDSVVTILHRILKKENIFEAHRSHLYQWLVNPGPFSHLQMASLYGLIQLLLNIIIYYGFDWELSNQIITAIAIWLILGFTYLFVKRYYMSKYNLV